MPKLEFCLFSLSCSVFLVLLIIKWVDNLVNDHVVQRARDSNHLQLSIAKPKSSEEKNTWLTDECTGACWLTVAVIKLQILEQ
jgi:hypothetical protein